MRDIIRVDTATRKLILPEGLTVAGVAGDKFPQNLYFEVDRYIDGVDYRPQSSSNYASKFELKYINAGNVAYTISGGHSGSGIEDTNYETVIVPFELPSNFFLAAGKVKFSLVLTRYIRNTPANVYNIWQSEIASLDVLEYIAV